ncbi:hypothetical protein SAMN05216249_1161 [Acetitomaculum ruminis DSM 5522]|uniref:Uncharacterized protein n=1 Tax=Acetitomaculum ruminis DSM 5522 TaxID=1120918 RepID=A0A1I0ZKD3_9FIRM|nr:hypothetical protein [Acetitomaculum ruminis]SFB26104.1 hypothetical protein SAMN05216249_1161 [Acetitomaculum ruminis DSM 5522]
MVEEMGITDKQFQGFIRLISGYIENALKKSTDNEEIQKLQDILNSMIEDA